MKVLYICADWGIPIRGYKGASVHVREFVNTLDRVGHEVTLIFAEAGEGNPYPNASLIELAPDRALEARSRQAAQLGIEIQAEDKVTCRELDKLAYDAEFAALALSRLRDAGFRPDVVYERFSLFHQAGAAIAEVFGVPYVVEVNAPLIEEQERHRALRLKALAHAAQTRCFQSANHIVTVSHALKRYIEAEGIPSYRVSCLPNGVDTQRFNPTTDPTPMRARYDLGDRPVIGFVGSLKPWHGMEALFDAMSLLSARSEDQRLLIVGDGPGFHYAMQRAEDDALKGRIVLAGKVPHHEVPAHLAAMDLTVAPYIAQEGFYFSPLKVLESLAAGRPVVAPRLGQLNELIEHGVTGLLYEPGNLNAFAQSVHGLLSDPQRRSMMAENARRHAVARLSWESVVGQAVGIISETLQAA
jgi:glycosyltransferase involved in cell wall biosynthesis